MTIKDIMSKVLAGTALTDEEKGFASSFDENSLAAQARRKAEQENQILKNQLSEYEKQKTEALEMVETEKSSKLTETQKLAKQIETLTGKMTSIEKEKADAIAQNKKMVRSQTIGGIKNKMGIQWIPGIDPTILDNAFESTFSNIEEFTDDVVKEKVEAFKNSNKSVILDVSGKARGSGAVPGLAGDSSSLSLEDIQKLVQRK